jgi:predicted O-methyltransferase YrrM
MSKGDSFIPILAKWLYVIYPSRVLEWGPGKSTKMIAQLRPNAEITTIEHNPMWYAIAKQTLSDCKNVDVRLIESRRKYTKPPVEGKFDLIFIDGHSRVACMKFAEKHLSPYGIVILHDSERERYEEGIKLFKILDEGDGTTCLGLGKSLYS